MKLKNIFSMMLVMLLALAAGAGAANKAELQARFERRYPQILQYKMAGKIGETQQGVLEAVDPKYMDDSKMAQLVSEENADRQELYRLIAKDEGTTPDIVAQRTAKRNYEKAKPG
jgi:uncharacterized protein YdbL (DUF1318 family)